MIKISIWIRKEWPKIKTNQYTGMKWLTYKKWKLDQFYSTLAKNNLRQYDPVSGSKLFQMIN